MSIRFIKRNINFDFVGKQKIFISASLIVCALSLVLIFGKGLNYGIDFLGGVTLQLKFKETTNVSFVRQTLAEAGFGAVTVQNIGEAQDNEYLIFLRSEATKDETEESRVLTQFSTQALDVFKKKLGVDPSGGDKVEVRKTDLVGAKVGSDLKKGAYLSILFSLILILIYIWFRFEYKYAPGAVIALVHDVTITLGVFAYFQKEFDLSVLAAILTLIGYSLNDTIVVFDRIRENVELRSGEHFPNIVNKSVNGTLSRTILTSLTTFFVVVALYFFGGPVINGFALALLVGIVVGTYSSIFIASPILMWIHKRQELKNA